MPIDFDYAAARKAGYSDDTILSGLKAKGMLDFDVDKARKDGYSSTDILGTLFADKPVAAQPASRSWAQAAGDTAADLALGVVGLGESVVGIGNLATFGAVGKGLEAIGYDAKQTKEFLSGLQSEQRQKSDREVAAADGFWETAKAIGVRPDVLIGNVVQALPGTLGSGAAAGLLVRKLGTVALTEAGALGLTGEKATAFVAKKITEQAGKIAAAAAAGEGAQTAGSIAEGARASGRDWDEYVLPSLGAGLGTAAINMVSGGLGRKLGIGDVETSLAQRAAGAEVRGTTARGIAARVPLEAVKEGVLEEAPQSYQEQVFQNIAMGEKDITKDASKSAATGMLAGMAMGGTNAAITPPARPDASSPTPEAAPLLLENRPDPFISFPDGSVGRQADVDNFISALPESDRIAARARLYGLAEQSAQAPTPADIMDPDKSVDEAIATAETILTAPTEFDADLRNQQIDAAFGKYMSEIRQQEFDLAEQSRRDADVPRMQSQVRDERVDLANAITEAQGFDTREPTAMELAMRRARAVATPMSKRGAIEAPAPASQAAGALPSAEVQTTEGLPNALPASAYDGNNGSPSVSDGAGSQQSAVPMPPESSAARIDDGADAAVVSGSLTTEQSIEQARSILSTANVKGKERLDVLAQVRDGSLSIADLRDAYEQPANPQTPTSPAGSEATPANKADAPSRAEIPQAEVGTAPAARQAESGAAKNNSAKQRIPDISATTSVSDRSAKVSDMSLDTSQSPVESIQSEYSKKAPPVKDKYAGEAFMTGAEARTFVLRNKIASTHRVEQTGREKFEIRAKPDADAPKKSNPLDAAAARDAKIESQLATANANAAKRKESVASLDSMSGKELREVSTSDKRAYMRNAAADILQTREQATRAKRSETGRKLWSKGMGIDPERDTMAQAIAKMGGVSSDSAKSRLRLAPEELSIRGKGVLRVFTSGGKTMDEVGAAMADLGYVERDENGKHDQRDFEGKLAELAGGTEILTPQGMMIRAEENARAAQEETGAQSQEDYEQVQDDADSATDAVEAAITEAFDNPNYEQDLTDEEIDRIFGIAPGGSGVSEVDTAGAPRQGGEGNQAPQFSLASESADEGRARVAQEEDRAKAERQEDAEAAKREREKQSGKEVVARMDASAENFQLGQSPEDGLSGQDVLWSKDAERDLVITHNLTEANLIHADKMGGIAVPSLAVTKGDSSLEGFGDITLIGSRAMADPKGYAGTKVFGADIYSPRYPTVQYKADRAALKKINKALESAREAIGAREFYGDDVSSARDLSDSTVVRYQALTDMGVRIELTRREDGTIDAWDTDNLVRRAMGDNDGAYQKSEDLANQLLQDAGAEERIFQGYTSGGNRKYVPHTLENVVKILKKELRGGENWNYGVGSLRAKFTPQFKSIAQIKAEKGRLVSAKDFETVKDEVKKEFDVVSGMLAPFHPASGSFGFGDTVTMTLGDAATMGLPRALKENGFDEVDADVLVEMRDFLEKLRHLPTAYFEAKILRDVDLSEFAGAVIPKNASQKVRDILARRGVKVKEYEGEKARAAAVDAFSKELDESAGDVRFSTQGRAANAFTAETILPALDTALKRYGKDFVKNLLATGKVKIVTSKEAAVVLGSQPEGPAFFNPKTGLTYIVADRIGKDATPEQLHGLVLHEVANHALQIGRSSAEFKALLKNFAMMEKAGNPKVKAAFARADDAGSSAVLRSEEGLGYYLEANPDLSLSQRFIAWLRAGIRSLGQSLPVLQRAAWLKSIDAMSVNDLVFAAQNVLQGAPSALAETQEQIAGQPAFSKPAGRTIEVDGVRRPITNSKGQRIADDFAKQKAFWKWFGSSAAVDSNGKPLVVYHGTKGDIAEFNISRGGEYGSGIYFSDDPGAAWMYADRASGESGQNIAASYLAMKNPFVTSDRNAVRAMGMKNLVAQGYDGIIATGTTGEKQYIVFDKSQVKSATGNSGTFDPTNADIRYSKSVRTGTEWVADSPTRLDDFLYALQDKQIDTKRTVQAITKVSGQIADELDPRLQETLFSGRSAKATQDFAVKELKPLYIDLAARGVTMDELQEYLHARHAKERNAQIAAINPKMPDGGSGMKDAEADKYMAGLSQAKRSAYDALAKRVDAINAETQKLLVDAGLEKQSTIDAWNAAYKHYVPLQRAEVGEGMPGIGQGFSVKGASTRRAMGSDKEVIDILANIAMQRERAILRAEKNKVATAVYGLAIDQPNSDFWLPVNPNKIDGMTPKAYQEMEFELIALGLNPADAASIMKEPKQRYVDPRTGLVSERINPAIRSAQNVLALRVNGEDRFVFFSEKDARAQRMAAALKNLDAEQLGIVLGAAAKVSRWFAAVNTQYNPVFGVVNVARDVQGALMNISTTEIAGKQKAVMGYTMSALRGIYSDIRAQRAGRSPISQWARLYEEFQKEGGQTGFRDMFSDSGDRARALQSEIDQITEGKLKGAGRAIFGWLSDYNETLENAVRLAAYKVATDQGISKQRAAVIAKELTVNFNRKGTMALQAGALYAFFNASVQGTARLAETLTGPAGKKIVAGGLLLGVMQALLLASAGFDDGEPPEFVKERSIVIPTGNGKYIAIPMPLGFHVIPSFSRIVTEWAMSGGKNTAMRTADIFGLFASSFNPIGSSGMSIQTIAPTAVDPLVALSENRDFTGKPIAREDISGLRKTPGYLRAKDTASELSKTLSYYLNLASGGTKYQAGVASPTPDQIDYLIGQVTGGVGRETMKAEQAVVSTITGEDLPPNKVPLLGRFYGDTQGNSAESSKFYDNIRRMNNHKLELDGRRENGENIAEYISENRDAVLSTMAVRVQSEVGKLNKIKRELVEAGANKERVKLIEMQIASRMRQLNERAEALREKAPAN